MVESGALPLARGLGFDGLRDLDLTTRFAAATLGSASPPVAIVVTGWGERLDRSWRQAVTEADKRRATWTLLFNGTHARLVETRHVYSRRHVEFALDLAMADPRAQAAFFGIFAAAAFRETESGAGSPITRLLHESEHHAAGVGQSLKDGVLTGAREVVRAIVRRPSAESLDDAFEQALTIVYRHPLSPVRRSAWPRPAVAPGLSRELQPGCAPRSRRKRPLRRQACGTRFAR